MPRRRMHLVWFTPLALILGCRAGSPENGEHAAPVDGGAQSPSASAPRDPPEIPTCAGFFEVHPRIRCNFIGYPTRADCTVTSQALRIDTFGDGTPYTPKEFWFEAALAAPLFASPFTTDDLCTSTDAPSGSIAVTCLGPKGDPFTVTARPEGRAIVVEADRKPPQRLTPPPDPSACPKLIPSFPRRDLEPLRRAYRDERPSQRCASRPAVKRRLTATFETQKIEPLTARVRFSVQGVGSRDLGTITTIGCGATRYTDVRGLLLTCSDDGLESRLAYQLGDAVYVTTADDRIERMELPCGGELRFTAPALAGTMEDRVFGD